MLIAAAALTGLAKTAVPGLASVTAALFALVLPAKESTGVMLALLLIGDAIALWAYRRDANTAVLIRLVPSVLAGVGLGALLLAVSTQAQMRRAIGAILLPLVIVTLAQRRWGPPRVIQGRVARAVYGTLAGFTTMAANAGGPVTSIYFLASRFSVSEFLGTTAWFFFTVNVIKAPFTVGMGLLRPEHLPLIGLLAPVVLAGASTGLPHSATCLRAPHHRDNDRGDSAAACIKKLSARTPDPRRHLSSSGLSVQRACTRWKQCKLVVEL